MSQVYTSFSLLAQVSITRRGIANRAPPLEVPINVGCRKSEIWVSEYGCITFTRPVTIPTTR
jgi:hypothetical protein